MDTTDSLFEEIRTRKIYHRYLELDLSKDELKELLKKSLVQDSLSLFRTRKARDLLTQLMTKIKSYASTPYAKLLVHTLLPTNNLEEIERRLDLCTRALSLDIDSLEFKELISLATQVRYDSHKKHNGMCVAFVDEEVYMRLRPVLSKKFYVTLLENEQDLIAIDHYEHIRLIKTKSVPLIRSAQTMSQVTIVESDELLDIAPEFITDVLEESAKSLEAISLLHSSLPSNFSLSMKSFSLQRESFTSVFSEMQELFTSFQQFLSQHISTAHFSGEQLITIVNKRQSILDYLASDVTLAIQEEKNALQKKLERLTGFSCLELFSINSLGEFIVDERELKVLETNYHAGQEESLYDKKVLIAKEWEPIIVQLPEIIEELYHYDLLVALRDFIHAYDLSKPVIVDQGIAFVYGKNMNIDNATPIEYHIGVDQQVAIVTGANSGGKTTLLELLGQIQILTHMGLYVPAKEAEVGLVDELYYFSKNKGSLNAGAFETLLEQFSKITLDDSKKLILADEIESVTEPDVAAKIIKGIISHLLSSKHNILVLVTHMGRELHELEVQGRFDGIEAKGLDKDLNLVVDRNPVIGRIARSTPQLIIERLAKLHENPFYNELKRLVT